MIIKKSKTKKNEKKIVGDSVTEIPKSIFTKTFPIAITRKRKMEILKSHFVIVKYEHDPGI